jgi:mannose-6-phosphate isomerase-like protein (cupin superfamily)
MNEVSRFIESGVLEMYVLGQATPAETLEVEQMIELHEEVRNEIDAICIRIEDYAQSIAIPPDPTVKPFLMATIDYIERMKAGEQPTFPPMLHAGSAIADYEQWLNREDMQLTEPLQDIHARIIGYTPQAITAIVWLSAGAPPETHTHEMEKFLIVEGTCDIVIGETVHKLQPGDFLEIPLHQNHWVSVTSSIPCKLILQRAAA